MNARIGSGCSQGGGARIAAKLQVSDRDRSTLAQIHVDPATQENDHFDYSKVVVRKPWGYEYLIFENSHLAVWILYLRHGHQTSMHCHPHKRTSITILAGEAICSTLDNELIRHAGEMMLLGEGVFHRTTAVSADGVFLIEIETPVNKRDLVRYHDDYGRESLGYETVDQMTLNVENYNYTSLNGPAVYYDTTKHFGQCSVRLVEFRAPDELQRALYAEAWNVGTVLKGVVNEQHGGMRLTAGDVVLFEDIASRSLRVDGVVQMILVSRDDAAVRLSDLIVSRLKQRGLTSYFYVAGASNIHLVDSIGRDTGVRSIFLQTEHAAALAAEAYAKLTGTPGLVVVASGSSASTALTGVADAWIDSTPMIVLSGQSRSSDLGVPGGDGLRQLANKELNIVGLVQPVTKYAVVARNAEEVAAALDRAVDAAIVHRCGPVWLDIPIDLLGKRVDERELAGGGGRRAFTHSDVEPDLVASADRVLAMMHGSARPVILAGHGIRAAGAVERFSRLAERLQIPVLTSRRGADLLPDDFPYYFGRPGTYGQRAANFIVQNADLLLAIGARLSLPLIGRNYPAFARAARRVMVDVDPGELAKRTVPADVTILADAGAFVDAMSARAKTVAAVRPEWLERCRQWQREFPPSRERSRLDEGDGVNPYAFTDALSEALASNDVVVVDGGHSLDYVMQSFHVKTGQRIISSPGLEHQGFALAGAVGAALGAARGQRVVCLCEKKGLQLNVAELETVANYKLPIKVFLFNGKGNLTVQRIQAAYFGGRHIGSSSSGVIASLDVVKLGEAYRLRSMTIGDAATVQRQIADALAVDGPVLCDVRLPDSVEIVPRVTLTVTEDGRWNARPIEDMYPFLNRDEFRRAMIIDPLEEA